MYTNRTIWVKHKLDPTYFQKKRMNTIVTQKFG